MVARVGPGVAPPRGSPTGRCPARRQGQPAAWGTQHRVRSGHRLPTGRRDQNRPARVQPLATGRRGAVPGRYARGQLAPPPAARSPRSATGHRNPGWDPRTHASCRPPRYSGAGSAHPEEPLSAVSRTELREWEAEGQPERGSRKEGSLDGEPGARSRARYPHPTTLRHGIVRYRGTRHRPTDRVPSPARGVTHRLLPGPPYEDAPRWSCDRDRKARIRRPGRVAGCTVLLPRRSFRHQSPPKRSSRPRQASSHPCPPRRQSRVHWSSPALLPAFLPGPSASTGSARSRGRDPEPSISACQHPLESGRT